MLNNIYNVENIDNCVKISNYNELDGDVIDTNITHLALSEYIENYINNFPCSIIKLNLSLECFFHNKINNLSSKLS